MNNSYSLSMPGSIPLHKSSRAFIILMIIFFLLLLGLTIYFIWTYHHITSIIDKES